MTLAPPPEQPAFWLLRQRPSLRRRIAAYVITSPAVSVRRAAIVARFSAWPAPVVREEVASLIRSRVLVDHGEGWIGHLVTDPQQIDAWRFA
jgi:hypothetical protein